MATQLQITNFCYTGSLHNATEEEKYTVIALSMYHRIGNYNPSNKYIINYKNKDILNIYKNISDERMTETNTLLKIFDVIHKLEIRVEQQNKDENKHKSKSKVKPPKIT